MLKWVRRILVFLLLGAIVNVVVAWGCVVANSSTKRSIGDYWNPYDGESLINVTTRFGFQWIASSGSREWSEQIGNTHRPYTGRVWWPALRGGKSVRVHCSAGWPLLALTSWQAFDSSDLDSHHWGIPWLRGSDWRPRRIYPLALPLFPMWTGFILNTSFYAAVLALVLWVPLAVRRGLRQRSGLCPACAYPRGTSPVCTECGEPLPC